MDPTLIRLARVIQNSTMGWPEHAKELADDFVIKVYFPYRFVCTYCQLSAVSSLCTTGLWFHFIGPSSNRS